MRIPESFIEQVRQSVNIADVVSQYVELHPEGKNLFGLCPFHDEKTASFSVSEDKQIFTCFSCHRAGNVFKFLMEKNQCTFPEAVLKVAEFANIQLPTSLAQQQDTLEHSFHEQLLKVYEKVTAFYHHILMKTVAGEPALAYLKQRQLTDTTLNRFLMGWAPQQESLLLTFLENQQVNRTLLVRSGLFAQRQDGTLVDRFRGRIMVPIRNQQGRVIAFSGRILTHHESDNEPKYLNSPETSLFNKSRTLFNLDLALSTIKREQDVFLLEGYMDVVSATQAGLDNAVASMGTSLTEAQLSTIARYAKRVVILYDGDDPGQKATDRVLSLSVPEHLELAVVTLPDGLDPDDYIRRYGAKQFKQFVGQHIQTPLEFKFSHLLQHYQLDRDVDKLAFTHEAILLIATASPLAAELYLKKISALTGLGIESLQNELSIAQIQSRRHQRAQQRQLQQQTQLAKSTVHSVKNRQQRAQERLLDLAFHHPEVAQQLQTEETIIMDPELQLLLSKWGEFSQQQPADIADFASQLDDRLTARLGEIEMQNYPPFESEAEIKDYFIIMKRTSIETSMKKLQQQLTTATNLSDDQTLQLTMDIIRLKRSLQQLE